MRFDVVQHIAAPADRVAEAYANPEFYATLQGLPPLSPPEVLSHEVDDGEVVRLRIRYRYVAELSSVVRAAVDPKKLSWVEVSTHHLADREVTLRMDPDNYADRFQASGTYRFEASGDGTSTARHCIGDVSIRMPLVGRRVEQAIVTGLQDHLAAEVPFIERWVAEHRG
jgi:hypothetical protein